LWCYCFLSFLANKNVHPPASSLLTTMSSLL
jgi:hypothetical protein